MADVDKPGGSRTNAVVPLDVILQVLGAGAAIVAWVVVVGGARLWARFEAADIPATQTLSVLPKNLFIVEGLQILLLPILVGAAVALFVFYSRVQDNGPVEERRPSGLIVVRQRGERSPRPPAERWRGPAVVVSEYADDHGVGEVVALAVLTGLALALSFLTAIDAWGRPLFALLGVGAALALMPLLLQRNGRGWLLISGIVVVAGVVAIALWQVRLGFLAVMLVVTGAALWLTLGALQTRSPSGVAWTLFGAFVIWCGALAFARERGQRHVRFEEVRVEFDAAGRESETGLYLGRSTDRLFYAIPEGKPPDKGRQVVAVNLDDVKTIMYGRHIDVPNEDLVPPKDRPTPTPTATPSVIGTAQPQPQPTPPTTAAPPDILDSEDGVIDGVPARIELTRLRLSGGLIRMTIRVVNRSNPYESGSRSLRIGDALDDKRGGDDGFDDSMDGITAIDPSGDWHAVARDERGVCGCELHLADAVVKPWDFMALSAVFRISGDPASIDVRIPRFGTLDDVALDRG